PVRLAPSPPATATGQSYFFRTRTGPQSNPNSTACPRWGDGRPTRGGTSSPGSGRRGPAPDRRGASPRCWIQRRLWFASRLPGPGARPHLRIHAAGGVHEPHARPRAAAVDAELVAGAVLRLLRVRPEVLPLVAALPLNRLLDLHRNSPSTFSANFIHRNRCPWGRCSQGSTGRWLAHPLSTQAAW